MSVINPYNPYVDLQGEEGQIYILVVCWRTSLEMAWVGSPASSTYQEEVLQHKWLVISREGMRFLQPRVQYPFLLYA